VTYIEVTLDDIAAANRLAAAVLGRSLDELAPQTRTLLLRLDALVRQRATEHARPREAIRFTRREVREFCGWSADQLDIHLARLERLEFVLSHHGGQGARYVYSLAYDGQGQDGQPFLMGLVDVATLASASIRPAEPTGLTSTSEASTPHFRPRSDPVPRAFRGGSVGSESEENGSDSRGFRSDEPESRKKGQGGGVSIPESHRTSNGHPAAAAAALPVVLVGAP